MSVVRLRREIRKTKPILYSLYYPRRTRYDKEGERVGTLKFLVNRFAALNTAYEHMKYSDLRT